MVWRGRGGEFKERRGKKEKKKLTAVSTPNYRIPPKLQSHLDNDAVVVAICNILSFHCSYRRIGAVKARQYSLASRRARIICHSCRGREGRQCCRCCWYLYAHLERFLFDWLVDIGCCVVRKRMLLMMMMMVWGLLWCCGVVVLIDNVIVRFGAKRKDTLLFREGEGRGRKRWGVWKIKIK